MAEAGKMTPKGSRKDSTGIRLRPDQTEALKQLLAHDKEATLSSLIRRAVDEYIERHSFRAQTAQAESHLTAEQLKALEVHISEVKKF
jgi:predicted transcriptional regulator